MSNTIDETNICPQCGYKRGSVHVCQLISIDETKLINKIAMELFERYERGVPYNWEDLAEVNQAIHRDNARFCIAAVKATGLVNMDDVLNAIDGVPMEVAEPTESYKQAYRETKQAIKDRIKVMQNEETI